MGTIPEQPCLNQPMYAIDTHRQLSASASSALPLAAQVNEPDLVKKPNKQMQWHASQMLGDSRWWPKMMCVSYQEGTNPHHLARLILASFKLPGVQFAQQEDAYWSDPPCLQCFNCSCYISPVERLFSGIDYRKQRRDKTLTYA